MAFFRKLKISLCTTFMGKMVITKWDGEELQSGTAFWYYKVRRVLLQSGTAFGITKWDSFITKWDRYYKVGQFYYKVGQVLQSGTIITKLS